MKEVKIGLIGCGYWGPNLARNFSENRHTDLRYVSDLNQARLEWIKGKHPGVRTTTDYRVLLRDPDVRAVAVATPVFPHFRIVKDALDAGKHVSVQNPMARNAAECKEMIEAAKRARGKFHLFECYPFYPPVVKAKELVDAGEIGTVSMVRLRTTAGSLECGWELTPTSLEWRFNQERVGGWSVKAAG